jgi:Rrf2 family protein
VISRTGLHALRALAQLALLEEGEFVGAARLGESIGAPQNYLGKLLQTIASAGLLESRKGLGGGFRLAVPAESIRLLDVVEPIDHVSRWEGCFLGRPICSDQSACAVHHSWAKLRDDYLSLLRNTTIADIIDTVREDRLRMTEGGHS